WIPRTSRGMTRRARMSSQRKLGSSSPVPGCGDLDPSFRWGDTGWEGRGRSGDGGELFGDGVEDGVDHAGGVVFVEGFGDVDVFGDDDAGGNVAATEEFEGGAAQDGAERGVDAADGPVV